MSVAPRKAAAVLPTDPGDRNRTSPFAFTGNRFEFRAPGWLQSIALPMVTINTIMAEALDHIATSIETSLAAGTGFNVAVQQVLEEIITNHGSVVFNGDGYSEDWQTEAASRGLPNLQHDALPELISDESVELFAHYGVFTRRESAATTSPWSMTPSASASRPGSPWRWPRPSSSRPRCAIRPSWRRTWPACGPSTWRPTPARSRRSPPPSRTCTPASPRCAPSSPTGPGRQPDKKPSTPLPAVRAAADALAAMVADDLWPLPTYQEMLYIL
jgi:glutamine synthetase